MPREITTHKLGVLNEHLAVEAVDEPGHGGASHHYRIGGWGMTQGAGNTVNVGEISADIFFQQGPINESAGINGISNESLLAVLIDRIKGFQSGRFNCYENGIALMHLTDAMHWLQHRTQQRLARGVEGTTAQ